MRISREPDSPTDQKFQFVDPGQLVEEGDWGVKVGAWLRDLESAKTGNLCGTLWSR